ncbi:MogA/MoaB family molybdenum cofactor biosynthesis protein [Lactonifactor longoviformis]|uniref:MogA/MoaB family molybdenum cofactor biosynthesis protein n=1 Tax=Lactonifactor longoviformis TaxID=341220 RepID=UPI001D003D52|nr:MogA/MoaB family molybdenum cofactor biosynthesis protein [Lactonifactor longoviformis]MCB5713319.1 MogA/MoaB family molybdenum cofactor biosynthesis protein [Lactonifactor longoviformis]MCB5717535.1 MogA/MoaB family molybdenum cofactor biosynthesis protein [Lactonifactor longoviformis]
MKRVAIVVASDSGYEGTREDKSGRVIKEIAERNGYQIVHTVLLPDERERLSRELAYLSDEGIADLILTTGGTGFSPRDCMPEATKAVIEREVPGIPEAMRFYSLQFTKRAMLSRQSAGIRRNTLIINLPGSPKAVRECLEYIISELEHGLEILAGEVSNCART